MLLVRSSFEILSPLDRRLVLPALELAGRVCYKSEGLIQEGSAGKFVEMVVGRRHDSVLEHCCATVRFVIDRGVGNELVRHRIASYSQESTRYCNYAKRGLVFIIPPHLYDIPEGQYSMMDLRRFKDGPFLWLTALLEAEANYLQLINEGWRPEQARDVLPLALKTEVVMTANMREWLHVFKMRAKSSAHPAMFDIMFSLQAEFIKELPEIFDQGELSCSY